MVRMMRGGRGRGGPRGGGAFHQDPGEPTEVGEVMNSCEGNQLLCKATVPKVPWFSKSVSLEGGGEIGRIDEILGPVTQHMFSVKTNEGVNPDSIKPGTKVYMGSNFLFPMTRFTEPKPMMRGRGRGGPRGRGGFRGGFGGPSRGGFRGGSSGGFRPRGFSRGGSRGY